MKTPIQPSNGTFAVSTLGCKVNQYDGQAIRERVAALGWQEVPFREKADFYIINTCTVTAEADEKCRKEVRRARRANSDARLVVTGCAARTAPERFRAIPGVSAVFTHAQMAGIGRWLETGLAPPERDIFDQKINAFSGHTRAFLKVEDGCDAGCAYCIVPRARGPVRSRPLSEIGSEAERLVAAGHVEIVLTGIHLGFYGRDLGGPFDVAQGRPEFHRMGRLRLGDAVRKVLAVPGIQRLRLSSIEATELTDELLDLAASEARFCPHFHLPLQSGDDALLAAMRRRYTAGEFLRTLDRARKRLDRPSFTTDVMVGFPGETEEQFERTGRVCREAGFSRIHIFPFSPRPLTVAADLPGRVPVRTVRQREDRLKALAAELALEYKRLFLGQTVFPLVEHRCDRATRLLAGWTERYVRVVFAGPDDLKGKIIPVRAEAATPQVIRGIMPAPR